MASLAARFVAPALMGEALTLSATPHASRRRPTKRRRVAMIVYDWSESLMGGSIRAISLARALPDHNWEPVVITASPRSEWPAEIQGVKVHHIPSRERSFGGGIATTSTDSRLDANPGWLRRLSVVKDLLPLERQLVWYPSFRRAAPEICRRTGVQVVVSVVAPNVIMPMGHRLARRLGVPHVIDLRDDYADRSRVEPITASYQQLLNMYGNWFTAKADGLTVVSPVTRDRFAGRGIRARLLMNGYVEKHFAGLGWQAVPRAQDGPLRIVHLGWLGDFRSIAPLVDAVRALPSPAQGMIRLEHYGLIDPEQEGLLADCPCETAVHAQISHKAAIGRMQDADILLAIPGDRVPAAMTGKLFEYLRARVPILLVAGRGAARQLGEQAGVSYLAEPGDVEAIAGMLNDMLSRKRSGRLVATSDPAFVRTLERSTGASLLANLLDEVVS